MISVVVVDDEPMVCAHLRTILGASGAIEVVEEAHDGAAGVEAVVRSRPDVVLMDLRMPGMDGLTAIERINKLAHPPAIVVLTTFDTDDDIYRAIKAGAKGYLLKDSRRDELLECIRKVNQGETCIPPALTAKTQDTETTSNLTKKEMDIS